jgi:gliding motility-associated-like protein
MNWKKKICVLIGVVLVSFAHAQSDTLFWFAAPAVTPQHENTPEVIHISTYSSPATVTISEPSNPSFQTQTVTIAAYSATTIALTSQLSYVENKPASTTLNYGLKISSSAKISAYYEVGQIYNPEIFPLKGTLGMGLKFLVPSQTTLENPTRFSLAKNGFAIVATEDSTTVNINLPVADSAGKTSYTITLNKGQTFAIRAAAQTLAAHLGGTTITADKPVSVTIYDDSLAANTVCSTCQCMDLIGDQILPEKNNGTEFIIVRGALSIGAAQDYYYVWPTVDGTTVIVNGISVGTFNRGQSYTGTLSANSAYIVTSNPVYLYQMTGVSCEEGATNLPSIKCTGSQLVSFTRSTSEIFQLNLLCKAADIGNFTVNGTSIPSSLFEAVPSTNNAWYAARITSSNYFNLNSLVPAGSASVVSNSSGLFHLGFVNGATNTGARFGYFSNYAKVQTAPQVISGTCFGTNIQLATLQVTGATYKWTGPNGFVDSVYNPVIKNAGFSNTGTYYLTAEVTGCDKTTDSVVVNVHPLPTVSFLKSLDSVCIGSSKNINFNLTGTAPWTFIYSTNSTKTDTLNKVVQSPSYFTVKPTAKSVYTAVNIIDSNACIMSTTPSMANIDTLMVDALPVANFTYSSPDCEKNAFTFYDSSYGNLDTVAHWYWIMGNGDTINTNSKKSFRETYNAWGSYTVKLAVQSSIGCLSDTVSKKLTVHPLPKPGFILPEVCLNDAYAQFADTTSIPDGNYNGWKFHWKFGDPNASLPNNPDTSIVQNPKHKYSAIGQYTVTLKVTSSNSCIDSLTQSFKVNGDKPKAIFTLNNLSIKCSNDSVKITNHSSVNFGDVTWLKIYWDYTNNPTKFDSIPNPSQTGSNVYAHLYPNFAPPTKSFQIHFAAYSGVTCVDTKDTIITVTASPVVAFTKMPGICYDAVTRQITQTKETNNVSGIFSYYGNGINITGLFDPKVAGVGNDTIKALYISAAGCRDSAYQSITVWPSPIARWGYSYPQCEKSGITFTDSSVANFSNIVNWKWVFGDGSSLNQSNNNPFKKIYTAYGADTAYLIVTTDSGCVSTPNSQIISVYPLPHVNFGMPEIVCLPNGNALFTDSTTIADNSQNLFSYKWSFGDANNLTGSLLKNPTHQYSALGNYSVKLVITSSNQCVDSSTKIFSNIYPQPKANFTVNAAEVCMGDSIRFSDSTTGYTGSVTAWNWNLAQGYTSFLQNPAKRFPDSGTYTITFFSYDAKGCVSDTISKQVIINPLPHLNLTHNVFVLEGGSLKLVPVFYVLQPAQFNWTPANYLDSTSIPYPITTPLDDITYKLELTGKGNCMVSDTIFVKVLRTPFIPNAFSPNGDGINDRWEIKYLNSYPGSEVSVFDRDGQPVFYSVGYSLPWDGTYKGKPLPIGTYYYIVNPKNGRKLMSGSVTILR